jgi:uncharacterized UBP type Zn finger protein
MEWLFDHANDPDIDSPLLKPPAAPPAPMVNIPFVPPQPQVQQGA